METWQKHFKENFRSLSELLQYLQFSKSLVDSFTEKSNFPLNLPKRLASKIEKGNLNDPLLRQFIPLQEELNSQEGFYETPVEDEAFALSERLLKKYNGRALLLTTSACAMHCRYCFRQNHPYETKGSKSFEKELKLLKQDKSIHELILSGGDPLSLSDRVLGELIEGLSTISHLKFLRIHTRFLIGIPERITQGLLKILQDAKQRVYVVIHVNHPRELDAQVISSLDNLRRSGAIILCQSVLLKGVNDSVDILKELSLSLLEVGIIPYYMHQLDRVKGAHHFEVDVEKGHKLLEELRREIPGYGNFEYVREIPFEPYKTPLGSTSYQAF